MGKRTASLLLLLALWLASAPAQDDKPTDDQIYDEVRMTLTVNPDVRGGAIEVEVTQGVVKLKGRVRDEKARKKAVEITKDVKGVTKVESELKLFSER